MKGENKMLEKQSIMTCTENLDSFLRGVKSLSDVLWSPKIDGVNCWGVVHSPTSVTYLSKNKKEFSNFKVFDNTMIDLAQFLNSKFRIKYPIIIESEVASKDKQLSQVMTQLRRLKNVNPDIFRMHVFDLPTLHNKPFRTRYNILSLFFKKNKYSNVFILPYYPLKTRTVAGLFSLRDKMIEKRYEGIMLRVGSSTYKFSKSPSKNCCKIKKFKSIEVKIVDIVMGRKGTRIENMVASLVCEYKRKKITVGTGFSDKDRKEFAKNPPIGKMIEIEFTEETPSGALREPRFKKIREDI